MRVTVSIGDGEAIPVRALPFVSPHSLDPLSPYRIVRDLAEPFDGPFEHESPNVNPRVLTGLHAYHLDENRKPAKILPGEWDRVACDIEAAEQTGARYDPAYRNQIRLLPPGVFVWRREFEQVLDGYKQGLREVTYDPLIPEDIAPLVMAGFEQGPVAGSDHPDTAPSPPVRTPACIGGCALHVVIAIGSRDAIPVRAIPFATAWTLSPDVVARDLGRYFEDPPPRMYEPTAYCLGQRGTVRPMLPKEWDVVVADLAALSAELTAAGKSREERHPIWRRASIRRLPAGTFLWRDEFESAFSRGYRYWGILDEREGDRGWTFDPVIPEDQQGDVMEGFEQCNGMVRPAAPTSPERAQ
jgi:hypothetical protein